MFRKLIFFLSGIVFSVYSIAQPPDIVSLSRQYGTVNETVILSGNNFNANPSNLLVSFGGVRGTVLESSNNSMTVRIPVNAVTGNITVTNKTNGLQGHSRDVFYVSFSGSGFDPALLGSEIDLAEAAEMFDLCLCDFNIDGRLDVATTKVASATDINVYRNTSTIGTLSFTKLNKFTNSELDLLSTTTNITCGDIDGDGLPDLAVTKSGNPRNVVFILRNISTITNIKFANAQSLFIPTEDIATRVAIKDLDKDGKPDIIVTNSFDNHVAIFRNKSTVGTFSFDAAPILVSITGASTTSGLAVEDINGDGYPEIAVNPFIAANIYTAVNTSTPGNISFAVPQVTSVSGNLNNLTWGDFNNDGKVDIAATKTIQNQIVILLNTTTQGSSTISFDASKTIATDSGPWGIHSADMDGNGKLDLIVALRDTRSINFFKNSDTQGTADFTKVSIPGSYFSRSTGAGDLDGDGRPDFVFTSFDVAASKYNLSLIRNINCFVPKVTPAGPIIVCSGDSKHLESTRGINITYRWDKDNVVVKENSDNFLDISAPGLYKVVAISDGGACSKVSNTVIANPGTGIVPDNPVINNSGPFCEGENIVLTTDPVTNGVYSWSGPNGFTSADQDITIPDASSDKAGIYSLQVTVGTCSSDLSTSVVEVSTLPDFVVSTNDPTTFCITYFVTLNVTSLGGFSYQWYKDNILIDGATGITYQADEVGSFNVEVISNSTLCKMMTNSIALTSIEAVNAEYIIDGRLCVGESLNIVNDSEYEISQPVDFLWSFGDGSPDVTTENTSHVYDTPGSYALSLSVAYQNGACSDLVSQLLEINVNPAVTITESPVGQICEGEAKTLGTNPTFGSYSWSTGANTAEIDVSSNGTYSVTVLDLNLCLAQAEIDITFLPRPVIEATANPEETDPGIPVQLEATGGVRYTWSPPDSLDNPNIANPVATVFEDIEFTVIGEDASGCRDTATVLVMVVEGNTLNVTPRKVFSPNGDGIDDEWIVENIERYPDCTLAIYNGNGSLVYETKPYNNDWNAVFNGRDLPEGAYFFVINCPDKEPKTGSITVIR